MIVIANGEDSSGVWKGTVIVCFQVLAHPGCPGNQCIGHFTYLLKIVSYFFINWLQNLNYVTHMSSLFRRLPPNGRNGSCPVAIWYSVTPMLHRSTAAVNCLQDGRFNTALSYMSGYWNLHMQTMISIELQHHHHNINSQHFLYCGPPVNQVMMSIWTYM